MATSKSRKPGRRRPSPPNDGPLTGRELGRLQAYFESHATGLPDVERLDGLLAGALAGPDVVLPSQLLPLILGPSSEETEPPFASAKEAEQILGLIMRHWNAIATGLLDGDYAPIVAEYSDDGTGDEGRGTGERVAPASQWVRGFLDGLELHPSAWRRLMADKSQRAALASLQNPPVETRNRQIWLDELAPIAVGVRHFFLGHAPESVKRAEGPPVPRPSSPVPHWEIGWLPLPGSIETEPDARLVAALIATESDRVLRTTPFTDPPADPARLARLLAEEVAAAIEEHGAPEEIWVLDQPSATALRRLPALRHVVIEVAESLPAFARARDGMIEHFGGPGPAGSAIATVRTWTSWGLEDGLVSDLFAAAATLYRKAPWRLYSDGEPFLLRWRSELEWLVILMGNAGIERGLMCLTDPRDFGIPFAADLDFGHLNGLMVSVVFAPQDDLPPPMRKEVMSRGWEVAALDAFPIALVHNAPTAGLAPDIARQLAEVMVVMARYGETKGRRRTPSWVDRATGVTVQRG